MPKLLFNRSKKLIRERVGKIDFVCTDLDQCLFPFFAQTLVSIMMLAEAFVKPGQWRYLPQLIKGASYVVPKKIKNLFIFKALDGRRFMDKYEEIMQGIPIDLVFRHSRYAHRLLCPHSLKFLGALRERDVVITILSLTIQPILEVLKEKIGFIEQCVGNEIEVSGSDNTFYGYKANRMNYGRDKLEKFKEMLRVYNVKTPLVIGHNENEIPLARYARRAKGLSIGINPKGSLSEEFDVVVKSLNWKPLLYLLDSHF